MSQWLSLLNYSAKYGISLSTLRRRIKNTSISFKQENGKYFIEDEGIPPQVQDNSPRQASKENIDPQIFSKETIAMNQTVPTFVEASVFTSANRLVEELKAAYAKILQEKEEQITQFKEEIVDLRMLVRIMEQQANSGVRSNPKSPDDIFFGDITLKDI